MLFTGSSEQKPQEQEGSFLVLIFEKQTRKRACAKSQPHFDKLQRHKAVREKYGRKFEEELVWTRDSKVRRFTNYFVTLFN